MKHTYKIIHTVKHPAVSKFNRKHTMLTLAWLLDLTASQDAVYWAHLFD